jgi:hypothetical protein
VNPFCLKSLKLFLPLIAAVVLCHLAQAQSNDQNFPTPVTSNELSGTIKARDIGDSRLTTHFYAFDGSQGDIFINVVTRNFTGDIDIFSAEGLRPLAKMVLYADAGVSENGRLIYVKQSEHLLLRVEGRTPNDDTATYQIKFAGSFVALKPGKPDKPPTISDEEKSNDTTVDVNAVGTVNPSKPKPKPKKTPEPVATDPDTDTSATTDKEKTKPERERIKPIVVVEDYPGESETTSKKAPDKTRPKETVRPPTTRKKPSIPKQPDPLANVHLVIAMKDGSVIERILSEVQRFNFDKGVLTVIGKDGKVTSFSMLDIDKVTIQ